MFFVALWWEKILWGVRLKWWKTDDGSLTKYILIHKQHEIYDCVKTSSLQVVYIHIQYVIMLLLVLHLMFKRTSCMLFPVLYAVWLCVPATDPLPSRDSHSQRCHLLLQTSWSCSAEATVVGDRERASGCTSTDIHSSWVRKWWPIFNAICSCCHTCMWMNLSWE